MMFDPVRQPLGCTTYEQTIAVVQILVNNTATLNVHLSALEATFIRTHQPNLCGQKQFVYSLKIFH